MPTPNNPLLIVLAGPTGVGKTRTAIALAEWLHVPVISADSRQVYREIPIGTAAPTPAEQAQAKHLLVGHKSVAEPFNASQYEQEVLQHLHSHFSHHQVALLAGGSGLYIDAVCRGIDDMPDTEPHIRDSVKKQWREQGLHSLLEELKTHDPVFYTQVDTHNPMRVRRAIEVIRQTGRPFSHFHRQAPRQRPFTVLRMALTMPRDALYQRINERVHLMIQAGLLDEALEVKAHWNKNALNTVGFKELFPYFRGEYGLERAVELIQRNSRRYAKRQLTWFRRHTNTFWFYPHEIPAMQTLIEQKMNALCR